VILRGVIGPLWRASIPVGLLAAAAVFAGFASSATTASPTITSVTFAGSEVKPTITIRGQHLGKRPVPDPAYVPLGHPPLCPPAPSKAPAAYGFDYGTSLFIADKTQQPVWSAGRYRPQLSELDCVGVIIIKFTPSIVVLRLGAFYAEGNIKLAANDRFQVGVKSARFSGRVKYG
jgi:hypothetical protein